MIILIYGASHTGKTLLAQKLLEKYKYPYLSLDHLKMGLIRSGQTKLTPEDDFELTPYLWSIAKEMVKTAIENKQNLIVEGCYIPFDWQKDFTADYIKEIRYVCLVMSESYINKNFGDILKFENAIETRLFSGLSKDDLITDNQKALEMCRAHSLDYILIDSSYDFDYEI